MLCRLCQQQQINNKPAQPLHHFGSSDYDIAIDLNSLYKWHGFLKSFILLYKLWCSIFYLVGLTWFILWTIFGSCVHSNIHTYMHRYPKAAIVQHGIVWTNSCLMGDAWIFMFVLLSVCPIRMRAYKLFASREHYIICTHARRFCWILWYSSSQHTKSLHQDTTKDTFVSQFRLS